MKAIKEILSVVLITYNRADQCKHMLEKIFSEDSPIKECDITIINNCSTDNTLSVIDELCENKENVNVVTNAINIGGNANIVRAFEYASKKYHWVLCDDDTIDWSLWGEIESALLSNKYSMIFVTDRITTRPSTLTPGYYAYVASFVPGVIYKSANINSDLIQVMYGMTLYWFPQSVLSLHIMFNLKENFYFPTRSLLIHQFSKTISDESDNVNEQSRGRNFIHPEVERVFWHVGFPIVAQIIKDKDLRKKVILQARFDEKFDEDVYKYLRGIVRFNSVYRDNNIRNLLDIFYSIGKYEKLKFFHSLFNMLLKKIKEIRPKK